MILHILPSRVAMNMEASRPCRAPPDSAHDGPTTHTQYLAVSPDRGHVNLQLHIRN